MSFKGILNATQKFVGDNSPGILTGLGVAGAVTTAILAAKAGFKTSDILTRERDAFPYEPSLKEKADLVWKEYIPPAIVGAATVTMIIAANRVGSRRAAALAAAFKISEELSSEYKTKVAEVVGRKTEEGIRAQIASDRAEKDLGYRTVIVTGSNAIFYDQFSDRYFESDVETVRRAVNDINQQVNQHYFASLTDFYNKIGLKETQISDEFGWNTDELLEVSFTAFMTEDNRPALMLQYNKTPIRGFDRVN